MDAQIARVDVCGPTFSLPDGTGWCRCNKPSKVAKIEFIVIYSSAYTFIQHESYRVLVFDQMTLAA